MTVTDPDAVDSVAQSRTTLKLYVAADSPDSDRALANLRQALDAVPAGRVAELDVIDVHQFPLAALRDRVVVTPTLLLDHRGKRTTVFGDLSDPVRIADVLVTLST